MSYDKKTYMGDMSSVGVFGSAGVLLKEDGDDEKMYLMFNYFGFSVKSHHLLCFTEQQPSVDFTFSEFGNVLQVLRPC